MIHEKLEKLIPHIEEHVISYPLWEEGKYIPFLQLWRIGKTLNKRKEILKKLKKITKDTGYETEIKYTSLPSGIIHFIVYPKFEEHVDGSYKFIKEDWSIEEMIDIIIKEFN